MAKPTTQQHTAAALLTRGWLDSLAYTIESLRGKSRVLTNVFGTSEQLALVTAHVVTRPRHENKSPSPLTVAKEIGQLLGATKPQAARAAGAALLGMAQAACFIDITDGKRRAGWEAAKEIRLSIPAEAQRADIEARLAANDIAPERPLLGLPPVQVSITRNYDGLEDAPKPVGLAVAEALAPIQSTAWRVNRYMLDTLSALAPAEETAAIKQATRYADAPEFWYRCNFDWRGRLYQQGGRLQYTSGTDAARSLLEFAHGERLTPDGYLWLAVHVATCRGVRGSFSDRASWTHKSESRIARAVADPVGSRWWRKAKEPYRFLAACRAWMDIAADRRAPVHLPVTADGTASAFQHYAWLLRDEALGARVNLSPCEFSDCPRDFYANLAKRSPYSRDEIKAQAWVIYGKRPEGAKERAVQKFLKEQTACVWTLYDSLRAAARRETKAGRAIEWTLPDGFRVLQANRAEDKSRKVELTLHTWKGPQRLQGRQRELTNVLDIYQQANGLPPNLIHSLDACLLRSVVREAVNVSRWAVAHDSIGVHPNDGGALRRAIVKAVECVYGPDVLASLGSWCDGVEHAAELPASMRGSWYTFS